MTAVLSEKSLNVINAIITNPGSNPADVSKYLGVSIQTVTGSLSTLKKAGLVTIEEGKLIPSAEAEFEYGGATTAPVTTMATLNTSTEEVATEMVAELPTETSTEMTTETTVDAAETTPGVAEVTTSKSTTTAAPAITKASLARPVFEANKDQPRKVLMALLMDPSVGLTSHGANTYIYNMRKNAGMVTARTAKDETVAPTASAPVEEIVEAPVVSTVAETEDATV